MKTVRQIADEIGVTKQAVFKKMKQESLATDLQGFISKEVDGKLLIDDDGERLIKQAFSQKYKSAVDSKNGDKNSRATQTNIGNTNNFDDVTHHENTLYSVVNMAVEVLTSQLKMKDLQLAEKDKQLAEKDKQLTEKDKQIVEKDRQLERQSRAIEDLAASLAAAQALHAGTLQQQLEGNTVPLLQEMEQEKAVEPKAGHRDYETMEPKTKKGFFFRMFRG